MKPVIVPALLIESEEQFAQQLRQTEDLVPLVQVDALDGSLFPNTTWFDGRAAGAIRTDVDIELHLMVENPLPIIKQWKRHVPTFTRAIVHAEMDRPLGVVIAEIRDHFGIHAGVAINPETPLSAVEDVIHDIDQLTIMSVHPGFQGQTFGDPEHVGGPHIIYEKIAQARRHRPDLLIEVDGGVSPSTFHELVSAGATRLCIGSALFTTDSPRDTLQEMQTHLASLSNE